MSWNFDTKSFDFGKNGMDVTVSIRNVAKITSVFQNGKTMSHMHTGALNIISNFVPCFYVNGKRME